MVLGVGVVARVEVVVDVVMVLVSGGIPSLHVEKKANRNQ